VLFLWVLDRGLSTLLLPGHIMLIRRPWQYVIHHVHFMNMYRLYIAWYRPILFLFFLKQFGNSRRQSTLQSIKTNQQLYLTLNHGTQESTLLIFINRFRMVFDQVRLLSTNNKILIPLFSVLLWEARLDHFFNSRF
jgi:hypothetical protein